MMIEIKSVTGRVFYVNPGAVPMVRPDDEKEGVWDVYVDPEPTIIEVTEAEAKKVIDFGKEPEGDNGWMSMFMAMMPLLMGRNGAR